MIVADNTSFSHNEQAMFSNQRMYENNAPGTVTTRTPSQILQEPVRVAGNPGRVHLDLCQNGSYHENPIPQGFRYGFKRL